MRNAHILWPATVISCALSQRNEALSSAASVHAERMSRDFGPLMVSAAHAFERLMMSAFSLPALTKVR
jgi:hypothetical protein